MHRAAILSALTQYEETWATGLAPYLSFSRDEENRRLQTFRDFVLQNEHCFERTCEEGHVTGSALVVNSSLNEVLLTLHRKLGKWLQLGGHCDGNPNVAETAMREACEESGVAALAFLPFESLFGPGLTPPLLFDIDVHEIPSRANEPQHFHFDARYLIVAKAPELILQSEESVDLRWHSLPNAYKLTDEKSMHRQFDKLTFLKMRL